jgi:hypothetical protein
MEQYAARIWERGQTIEELNELVRFAEEVAQRLVEESHFESYDDAHSLLIILHRARLAAELIRRKHRLA